MKFANLLTALVSLVAFGVAIAVPVETDVNDVDSASAQRGSQDRRGLVDLSRRETDYNDVDMLSAQRGAQNTTTTTV
ncbi:hypothetical protein MSAN_02000200 [Mycena sanguinolenta]|uniref:RxLR effector protein n=1 Tax=Mycena sanguinolenta TaxID=230812 RepID=A0A8H6XLS9_9AGAR|nr:hypothetical protein MSAN_02000200 [Mycena sanguinolenta]